MQLTAFVFFLLFFGKKFLEAGKLFNLIAEGKSIDYTPYKSIEDAPSQRCISICSLDPKCFSFDYKPATRYYNCNFYDVLFRTYQNQSRALRTQPGTKYYSVDFAQDCAQWYTLGYRNDGLYQVIILGKYKRKVYCLMEQAGGGWMAFQRRFDGSVKFLDRTWSEFKNGFGDPEGEYYLGNELLHLLTTSEHHDYLVRGTDFFGVTKMKIIHKVRIESESLKYQINYEEEDIDSTFSTVDYGRLMRGMKFTTIDSDNDVAGHNCAARGYGAWWHEKCHRVAMNGPYKNYHGYTTKGIIWKSFDENNVGYKNLKESLLLVRPSSFQW